MSNFITQQYRRSKELGIKRLVESYRRKGYINVYAESVGMRDKDGLYIINVYGEHTEAYNAPWPTALRNAIKCTGLPQYQIAPLVGLTAQGIANYTNGRIKNPKRYVKIIDEIKNLDGLIDAHKPLISYSVAYTLLPIGHNKGDQNV